MLARFDYTLITIADSQTSTHSARMLRKITRVVNQALQSSHGPDNSQRVIASDRTSGGWTGNLAYSN
jgi:hypothetical protein